VARDPSTEVYMAVRDARKTLICFKQIRMGKGLSKVHTVHLSGTPCTTPLVCEQFYLLFTFCGRDKGWESAGKA
jgi:hypothetical protein